MMVIVIIIVMIVRWEYSDVKWASRWDVYLYATDEQIHWFSIVNSLMIVLFLSGAPRAYEWYPWLSPWLPRVDFPAACCLLPAACCLLPAALTTQFLS